MEIAKTDEQIMACFDVMKQLRSQLKEESWLATIRDMQGEGYVLAYLTRDDVVAAVAGYYICNKLSVNGKFVNGVSQSSVKKGYLCLESEGAEIHFRNIRIMELPPGVTSEEQTAPVVED